MNKNILKIILVIIVAVSLISVANYLYGDESKDSSEPKSSSPSLSEKYSNDKYRFSFQYSSGLKVSEFPSPDDSGYVVLAVDSQSNLGMQVYITPFDEPASALTVDRVRNSLPSVNLIDPKEVKVGGSGVGVIFHDGSDQGAKVQEWFVAGGNLYQITAPVDFEGTLREIIDSWKFI